MSAAEAPKPQSHQPDKSSDALERLEEQVGVDFARRLVAALKGPQTRRGPAAR